MKTIKQLAPNQSYFESGNKMKFQSYETIVCTIENYEDKNNQIIKITEGQPQSKTTAKYLNQFLTKFTNYTNYKEI